MTAPGQARPPMSGHELVVKAQAELSGHTPIIAMARLMRRVPEPEYPAVVAAGFKVAETMAANDEAWPVTNPVSREERLMIVMFTLGLAAGKALES